MEDRKRQKLEKENKYKNKGKKTKKERQNIAYDILR
jgi:hypothetical protein